MAKNINKSGRVNYELVALLTLMLVILAIIIVSSFVTYDKLNNKSNPQNIKYFYNSILVKMRYDTSFAVSAVTASNSLTLLDNNSKLISKYELKDNNLFRTDKNNSITTILENIESVSFTSSKDLSNLITIRIYPGNKYEIPFFTSFALRGTGQ